jgi:hypothetical protein
MKEIFIVSGSRGDYSYRVEWNVVARETESEAKQFVEDCQSSVRAAVCVYHNESRLIWEKYRDEYKKTGQLAIEQKNIEFSDLAEKLNKTLMDPFASVSNSDMRTVLYWYTVVSSGPPREEAKNNKYRLKHFYWPKINC